MVSASSASASKTILQLVPVHTGCRQRRFRRLDRPATRRCGRDLGIIGNDGITLCREAPAAIGEGEIVVASREELHAAPLSGRRLLERADRARPNSALGGGPVQRAEIEAALDRAEELVAVTEGRSLSPRILGTPRPPRRRLGCHTPAADRALREALDLYRTIGATGDGARLGTGIGA